MNILHFTLGLPPERSGGLTKYATDLMVSQAEMGDCVSLLYPGDFTFWKFTNTKIVSRNNYQSISVYELENPSPVALMHGLKNPLCILNKTRNLTKENIAIFYEKTKPDVFHLHTLMGLPLDLLEFLKYKGTKIVFTSHDYYGLCLKVNFINHDGKVCASSEGEKCAICNANSSSSLFLRLRNSSYLLRYKNKIAFLKKSVKTPQKITRSQEQAVTPEKIEQYEALINLYKKMFSLVCCFHFNSNVSREVYRKHFQVDKYFVLPITHADIKDGRRLKKVNKAHIRLCYIGPSAVYKGLSLLRDALHELGNEGINNWSLQVWGTQSQAEEPHDKISYRGYYNFKDLKNIFDGVDLLIVPSIWKETFSLVTLEALSHGVPVMISENIGAKDIIESYDKDFIFPSNYEALKCNLKRLFLNPLLLDGFNKRICESAFKFSILDHSKSIKQMYKNI